MEEILLIFEVRNDKGRGLLIETLETPNKEKYFFKWDDQPLKRHCEQMQRIVRKAKVIRSKKLKVDVSGFLNEYYRSEDQTIMFRATKLKSVTQQIERIHEMRINKEFSIKKRKVTIAKNKEIRIAEKRQQMKDKMKADEEKFRAEREKRIKAFTRAQRGNGNESPGHGRRISREF